ncbi:protein FAM200B-like [Acyrthosiphon pisum]|uniref:52 kDa repressor of the inhibitor of the protein kinase-like n=1 Tax=Acyrthosiphon pisum TaxID=7029 RepID=A0A8R2JVR9_ACYPI|nr:protein FAM200B-like [Acyrthosiphon pisum]
MFDETTDISCTEQLTLVLRYVINNEIHEDFVTFLDAYQSIRQEDKSNSGESKLTGHALGHIVIDVLTKDFGNALKLCVGIGTDGCSVMISQDCGVVTEILKQCTNAVRCPCYNHALNNSLAQSSKIVTVRNTIGTLKEIISFFNASAKRHLVLKNILGKTLTGLCQTRWIEMHDGILQFKSALPKIVEALTEVSMWSERISSSKASILLSAINNSEFIICILAMVDVLKLTMPISRLLQSTSLDLANASSSIDGVKEILEEKRKNVVSEFKAIFSNASDLATVIGFDLRMPRIVGKQINRSNYQAKDTEQYYLRSIYIPLLDTVKTDMTLRLSTSNLEAYDLRLLIPKTIVVLTDKDSCEKKNIIKRILNVATKFSKLYAEVKLMTPDLLEGIYLITNNQT